MIASPTITIDAAGVGTWTPPDVLPAFWNVVIYFDDAKVDPIFVAPSTPDPGDSSFDFFGAGFFGGLRVGLVASDANGNVLSRPVPSVGFLTKNQ